MKHVDVKIKHIDCSKNINNEDAKFKIGDIIRISKYKNVFTIGFAPNSSEEVLVKS